MYVIYHSETNEIIKSGLDALVFPHIVDAEMWIDQQAQEDVKELESQGLDEYTADDCKKDYSIKELKVKCGYDDGVQICEDVQEVRSAVKWGIIEAEKDRPDEEDAIEYLTFEIYGDCKEFNGNYTIYEATKEGEIINSNLPDAIRNVF